MSDRDLSYDDAEFADELGRTIRLMRIDRRIERRDLAEQVGISYSYLSAIENGTKTPSAKLLYTLARALGMRDDELLATVRERLAGGPAHSMSAPPPPITASAPAAPARPVAASPRLFARRGRPRPEPPAATDDDVVQEIADVVAQLDPDDAAAVLDLARRLAGR